jgi:hypothetical protein
MVTMADTYTVPRSHAEALDHLVRSHTDCPYILRVLALPDQGDGAVRLLEVTEAVPTTGEAFAFHLGPSADFPFALEIIQVTPEEWEQINAQPPAISLPDGWSLGELQQKWPR